MRLLLDEMYPPQVADQLRKREHDVSAVAERQELRSLPDTDLFDAAQAERRAVATENISDFARIVDDFDRRGKVHFGLVFIDPVKFARGRQRTVGLLVTELNRLLVSHPDDSATNHRFWL